MAVLEASAAAMGTVDAQVANTVAGRSGVEEEEDRASRGCRSVAVRGHPS